MSVSLTLKQTSSIADLTRYRVKHEITDAVGSSTAVFVYKTATQEFDHCALVADLESYPDSYEQALIDAAMFYRLPFVVRDHLTVVLAEADLRLMRQRLRSLAVELDAVQGDFLAVTTTVITGD